MATHEITRNLSGLARALAQQGLMVEHEVESLQTQAHASGVSFVEQLGEIPDAGTRVRVAGQGMEILQTQDRAIKVVRLLAPVGRSAAPPPPLQSVDGRASSSG